MKELNTTIDININDILREKIQEMDLDDLITDILRDLITKEVKENIKSKTATVIGKLVNIESEKILAGEIKVNDGWGPDKTYKNFEEFFKSMFQKKLADNYDLKRDIERMASKKVTELFEAKKEEAIAKVVAEMIK